MKKRNCPICNYKKKETMYQQTFAGNFSHRISLCLRCDFVFVDNVPDQSYYDDYYKEFSKYESDRSHEAHSDSTRKFLSTFLAKNVPKNAKILDIGCSIGELLNFIQTLGYKNIYGFDPAPGCRAIAYEKYNIRIQTASIEKFSTAKKYDFVILSQVLEHLIDIRGAVAKISQLLTPGGYLFIGVPDAGSFDEPREEPFGEFSTEHINFFSSHSLFTLLNNYMLRQLESDGKVLLSIWQKNATEQTKLDTYIKNSMKQMKHMKNIISKAPSEMIVWGAGALTQKLLETTKLRHKVFKFVDINKHLIGKTMAGIEIISPRDLYKYKNPILIASFRYREEIKESIQKMKLPNRVITF